MKTNEMPEKIYLQVCGDCQDNDCDNCKFEDLEDNVTWCKDKIFDKDVEYIRTDAFIEKAREWLNKESESYVKTGGLGAYVTYEGLDVKELVEDFEKYMRGE